MCTDTREDVCLCVREGKRGGVVVGGELGCLQISPILHCLSARKNYNSEYKRTN